ncbi:MAG TPA: thiolase, partial [Bacillota bacterium]
PYGMLSPIGVYALATQRHMHLYGTTPEQLGEIAVATRKWAMLNPKAYKREPLTLEDYLASPFISEPLRRDDICLVTDGGGAVIVTRIERARGLPKPPVVIEGIAERVSHHYWLAGVDDILELEMVRDTGRRAFAMAGLRPDDIDVLQLYDAFTIMPLLAVEALGFCERGEGGHFFANQRTAPGGEIPVNTSGGGLSYCHPGMFGIFLIIEAVRQLRGECGERQVQNPRHILCHAYGGQWSASATLILGRD